ncbi:hypothetical protein BJV74DRAFT_877173 [Russula compacta]|nr:hypothetical protein BJV74DRAFT_877173 [Russula compacta]
MALLTPPFPPSGRFVELVRESSRTLIQGEGVTIPDATIERLLLSPAFTETYRRITATPHGLAFPLKFPSPLSELNFLSFLALLNIASGYHVPLHRETGRGAWDSIRAFVYGLYLSSATDGEGDLLGARGMQTLSEAKIAELLGVSLHTERQHESIQGLTISQLGGPGWELVQLLKTLLDETGKVLANGGYPNLGSFVAEALKEGARVAHVKRDLTAAADVVLERLVSAIPGFRDMGIVNNQPIYCFKKALFLINAISIRFGAKDPPSFPVPHVSHLPVFADNVLPSILIHLGVIDLSTAASQALISLFPTANASASGAAELAAAAEPAQLLAAPKEVPLAESPARNAIVDGPALTPAQSYVLRAAAIEACERIVERAHAMSAAGRGAPWLKDVTLPDLDHWLWAVAKDRADYRALPRFVLRNTPFF